MNRVINFILLSLLLFSVMTFFINEVDDESDVYLFGLKEVVTNTTIFKELDPDLKVKKVLRDFGFTNPTYTIERNLDLNITEKECELIMILNIKKKVSLKTLQEEVWKYSSELDTHTVETHIYRLRKKMSDKFNDESFIGFNNKHYYLS